MRILGRSRARLHTVVWGTAWRFDRPAYVLRSFDLRLSNNATLRLYFDRPLDSFLDHTSLRSSAGPGTSKTAVVAAYIFRFIPY
jgi:hypothetical protein